jgi:hypothetical protein
MSNPLQMAFDSPNGQASPIFGTVHFDGWAVDTFGTVYNIAIAVDGVPYGNATYGVSRLDVCSTYSGPSCPNVGWDYIFDTTLLANGPHTLAATATTTSGQSSTSTVPFNVAN